MDCVSCGAANAGGKRYCGDCGAQLPIACSACGEFNPPGKRYCSDCGNPLREVLPHAPEPVARLSLRPLAERRYLTVMFCDLVGSTRMAGRLDPGGPSRRNDRVSQLRR